MFYYQNSSKSFCAQINAQAHQRFVAHFIFRLGCETLYILSFRRPQLDSARLCWHGSKYPRWCKYKIFFELIPANVPALCIKMEKWTWPFYTSFSLKSYREYIAQNFGVKECFQLLTPYLARVLGGLAKHL